MRESFWEEGTSLSGSFLGCFGMDRWDAVLGGQSRCLPW